MEEAAQHVSRVRTTFDEDDQADLYMKVQAHAEGGGRGPQRDRQRAACRVVAGRGGGWKRGPVCKRVSGREAEGSWVAGVVRSEDA